MGRTLSSGAASLRMFILACGVFLAAGTILSGIGPNLPLLALQIEQDLATVGWLFSALSAGVILAQVVAGRAADRFGQRLVLVVGMLFLSAGTVALSLSPNLLALLAGALLAGAGFGGVLAAGNLLIAELFPGRSATALNALNVFFGVGAMLGPIVVGLAGDYMGRPQLALWLGSGLLLVLAPLFQLGADPVRLSSTPAPAGEAASQPSGMWLLGIFLLVYIGAEVAVGGWVTVYMIESTTLPHASAALVASGFWLALTAGRVVGAGLGLRLTPQLLIALSLLGLLSGALLLVLGVGSIGISIAAVLLYGLSCGPVFPTVLALAASSARGNGTATSMVLALGNCGGLLIPTLLGLLLTHYGPAAAATMVLAAALTMVSLGAVALRSGKAAPALVDC